VSIALIAVMVLLAGAAALVGWTWYSKTRPSWAPLPNGYELCRIDAYCYVSGSEASPRFGHDGYAAPPHVDRLAVVNEWVVGHVEFSELVPNSRDSQDGFFAVDTKNHERILAMPEAEWRDFLRERKIADPPPALAGFRDYLHEHGRRGGPMTP